MPYGYAGGWSPAGSASWKAALKSAIRSRPAISLPRARVPAADTPQREKLTRIVAGVLIVAALHLGREVVIPFPVLRLAGRGRLDVAAATMLAQLLQKHGIGARVEADPAASRESIETLDVTGVAMVFVSCLDLGGSPLRIRALLRRLRQRIPGVKILIGLWPHPAAENHGRCRVGGRRRR